LKWLTGALCGSDCGLCDKKSDQKQGYFLTAKFAKAVQRTQRAVFRHKAARNPCRAEIFGVAPHKKNAGQKARRFQPKK